ncbi:MAG: hypothetical protein PHY72_04110 [Candidatus Pacebacteria bacterium]|nr:hypothetical protein [Candidatus Paceibacterota bacterium]
MFEVEEVYDGGGFLSWQAAYRRVSSYFLDSCFVILPSILILSPHIDTLEIKYGLGWREDKIEKMTNMFVEAGLGVIIIWRAYY